MVSGYFIDANLLVLLVVGSAGRDYISKHRRLRRFSKEDYDLLLRLIRKAKGTRRVFVTPNTLTETSNLLGQHGEPERSLFYESLRFLIESSEEVIVTSATAASNSAFGRLGLADAALLEAVTVDTPLITVDVELYVQVLSKGENAAINFARVQDMYI